MAPNRRNAAKSRGDQRKWKFGELVFAKIEGWPSWPAMVDDPTRWSITGKSRKVCVLFFGTRQLAFCNPVDVEAFTEEKMEQLRREVKCQTNGADTDFVRAVNQINEYMEKLKSGDESKNVGEVAMPNGSNSEESLADSCVTGEASSATSGMIFT